jgi:LPS O-antigen subunit length determinant protein (WzzB/FepE family)
MTQNPNTMNFLPEDYVEKRQAARSAVVFVGLLFVLVAGIFATFLVRKWQSDVIFVEQSKVNA